MIFLKKINKEKRKKQGETTGGDSHTDIYIYIYTVDIMFTVMTIFFIRILIYIYKGNMVYSDKKIM